MVGESALGRESGKRAGQKKGLSQINRTREEERRVGRLDEEEMQEKKVAEKGETKGLQNVPRIKSYLQ